MQKENRIITSCTFSGLLILEARLAALPLLSDTETAEKRFSSSDISISGALPKKMSFDIKCTTYTKKRKIIKKM